MEDLINWQQSSGCSGGACVQVAFVDDNTILVRNSDDPDGSVLQFNRAEWIAFVEGAKLGEFRF